MKYLALEDCSNHSKLHHHLQSLKDEFYKNICIPSAISYLPGMKRYQDFLKSSYTNTANVELQNILETNIHQYVNLSLITPKNQDKSNDYFKALKGPFQLLFNHKEYTTTVPINSLAEIFDPSKSSPQIILIQGSPGSGKTTLANKICTEWAKGNLVQHYILVILLKLRDPRISDIQSIDEMVKCTMGENCASEVVHDINCINGENFLLLLEGWDELPEEKHYKSFFTDIISGRALKNVNILITSRPSSIGSIQKRFITRHIAILGFTKDQIEQYLDHYFAESSDELKHNFLLQLKSNPILKSLAYVPVNLSILVHVFTQCGTRFPNTFTELYKQYVLLKISLYDCKISNNSVMYTELDRLPVYISESLNKLCELAYYGVKVQKLHFTQGEIQNLYHSVSLDYDGMGLLQVDNCMLYTGSHKTYNFLHKTLQEFLAAWHMTKFHELKNKILENFKVEHFKMVLVFFAGLSGFKLTDFDEVLHFIKKDPRINIIVNMLSRFSGFVYDKHAVDELKNSFQRECIDQHYLLLLITCCAEAKNPAVCKAISNTFLFHRDGCSVYLSHSAITPYLLSSLSYCIVHSGKNWNLQCDVVLDEQVLANLQRYLIDANETTGKLVSLRTQTNRNTIHFVATFLQPHFTLCVLNLSHSCLHHEDVTVLSEGLKLNSSLQYLDLYDCGIRSKGIFIIAEMLLINKTLKVIDLRSNYFSSDNLIQALVTMKSNTTLSSMHVDSELVQEKVIEHLIIFNEQRKYSLSLNPYHNCNRLLVYCLSLLYWQIFFLILEYEISS